MIMTMTVTTTMKTIKLCSNADVALVVDELGY